MVKLLKLGRDKKNIFRLKTVATILTVSLIVVISSLFMLDNEGIQKISNNPLINAYMDIGRHTNNAISGIGGIFSDIVNFKRNADMVRELKVENEKLKREVIIEKSNNSKVLSLESLKRSLNFVSSDEKVNMVSARVIGKNDGDWFKSFIIDAGADNGVKKDSIVINGDGVVGIVYGVTNRYSKAISIIDSRASVSFKVVGNDLDKGVITTSQNVGISSFKDIDKLLSGYMFDLNSNVKVGDDIVTSGLGLYPENIPIGRITEVISDKNKSMKIVKIRPAVDFKSINEVSIIPPRKLD